MKIVYDNPLFLIGRPFSPIYGMLMLVRRRLYKSGRLRSFHASIPVISVGNLILGGSGKTPFVEAISKWAIKEGLVPCILTRGYGGGVGRGPEVLLDGDQISMGPEQAGDEPFMLAKRLLRWCKSGANRVKPLIIVGSDRVQGAKKAILLGADLIVLDDGFQHLRLKRDLDILLFPHDIELDKLRVFPGGVLREPLTVAKDADLFVITKAPKGLKRERLEHFSSILGKGQFGVSRYCPKGVLKANCVEVKSLDFLKGRRVLAFCGIGDPGSFKGMVEGLGAEVVGFMPYRDHHKYGKGDIHHIQREFFKRKAEILLTTEKDLVKFAPFGGLDLRDGLFSWMEERLYALIIEMEVEPKLFEMLNNFIKIKRNAKKG